MNQRKKKGIIFESRLHNFLQKRLRFAMIPFKDSSYDANSLSVLCKVICLEATSSTACSNDLMTAWRFSHANSCQGNYVDTVSALAARCEHVETGCDSWSGLCRRVDNTMPLLMFVMYVHVHERIYTHKHFVHTARGQNIIFYYFCSIRQN